MTEQQLKEVVPTLERPDLERFNWLFIQDELDQQHTELVETDDRNVAPATMADAFGQLL